jgi:hypothetical protein
MGFGMATATAGAGSANVGGSEESTGSEGTAAAAVPDAGTASLAGIAGAGFGLVAFLIRLRMRGVTSIWTLPRLGDLLCGSS